MEHFTNYEPILCSAACSVETGALSKACGGLAPRPVEAPT